MIQGPLAKIAMKKNIYIYLFSRRIIKKYKYIFFKTKISKNIKGCIYILIIGWKTNN